MQQALDRIGSNDTTQVNRSKARQKLTVGYALVRDHQGREP